MLLQNDPVAIYKNLQFIPLSNVKIAPKLNGENDSSQFIYFADHTGCLHMHHSFFYSI